jgi:hypothetical protein
MNFRAMRIDFNAKAMRLHNFFMRPHCYVYATAML